MTKQTHCTEDVLALYHYDALSDDERQRADEHLEQCPTCQAELTQLRTELSVLVDNVKPLSDDERHRFTAKVMKNRPRRLWHLPAFGGALSALAVLVAVVIWQPNITPSTKAPSPVPVALETTLTDAAPMAMVAGVEPVDQFELIDQMELLHNLELLRHIDLLHEVES